MILSFPRDCGERLQKCTTHSGYLSDHRLHVDEALKLARNEIKIRRDIYAYDTLAWAEFQAGKIAKARSDMARALATGSRDTLLLSHSATINHP